MSDKIKETAKQEVEQIKKVASEGVRSGAYVYPLKASHNNTLMSNGIANTVHQGIFYLLSHKELRKPLFSRLIPTLTLATRTYLLAAVASAKHM